MNKRFTSLMTTLILSVFFAVSASAYDVEVDGIYYNLAKNLAFVTSGDKKYEGEIVIPESITVNEKSYTVKEIQENAFQYCIDLTSVTIPNSVTSIGMWAFRDCSGLTSITIPNSVTSIGAAAFFCCTGLTSVTIPNSITYIEGSVFGGCSGLKSVKIPDSVTNIAAYAFANCSGLKSITIPNSVEMIGYYTFANCTGLTSITIPNSVTTISDHAFIGCSGLVSVTIGSAVEFIREYAFAECKNLETVKCLPVKIPNTSRDAFDYSLIEYSTLIVPESALEEYKTCYPWKDFGTFKTLEETEVETIKCETPTISFANGELVYNCATEGVEYVSEIKSNDINKFYTDKVSLSACYEITCYAKAEGYDNSDVATAKLYWLPSSGTLEGDNINNVAMRGIAIQSACGFINISGLDNNENVDFFGVDGKALGTAKSINGSVSFSAQEGSIIIAKIGKESVKIIVE